MITRDLMYFKTRVTVAKKTPKIYAEGDSWFAYPGERLLGYHTNLLFWIEKPYNIFSDSRNGDTLMEMLGRGLPKIRRTLAFQKFDVMLLSGGGNDFADKYVLQNIIHPYSPGATAHSLVDHDKLQMFLTDLMLLLRSFVSEVFEIQPKIKILTHCYDYPQINGEGFEVLGANVVGPWFYPVMLHEKGITDLGLRNEIGVVLIDAFYEALNGLSKEFPGRFLVTDTRGKCSAEDWENELHPNVRGFGKVSVPFERDLKAVLKPNKTSKPN